MKALKIALFALAALFAAFAGHAQEAFLPPPPEFIGVPVRSSSIQIFPNPAVETVNIRFEMPCAKRIQLTLHNIIGSTLEVETELLDEHELQLKVKDLPAGYYLISLRDPDTNFKNTYKFIKR